MKLTDAQECVYYNLMVSIEHARNCNTFEEYFIKHYSKHLPKSYNTPDTYKAWDKGGYAHKQQDWEDKRKGIIYTNANRNTLRALEKKGCITILLECGVCKVQINNI